MLSYWREQAEKFHTAFKESEKQTESALEQQRQDHKVALLTLREQIQIFDSTIADLEEQLTLATWEKFCKQTVPANTLTKFGNAVWLYYHIMLAYTTLMM